jgi:hemoglobin
VKIEVNFKKSESKGIIMKTILTAMALVALLGFNLAAMAGTGSEAAPTADQQVKSLEQMCEDSASARSARHAEKTLYERLGKEKGINAITTEIVRLHRLNPAIKHHLEGGDDAALAKHVADFMVSGMGGPNIYTNRPSLTDSHRHLKLTNADFMAAGGDVMQAMKNLGHGQNEIDEVVCALVGLRSLVVLADDPHAGHAH